jgi:hypothetical protein
VSYHICVLLKAEEEDGLGDGGLQVGSTAVGGVLAHKDLGPGGD